MSIDRQSNPEKQQFVVVRASDGKVFQFGSAKALWDFAYDHMLMDMIEVKEKHRLWIDGGRP